MRTGTPGPQVRLIVSLIAAALTFGGGHALAAGSGTAPDEDAKASGAGHKRPNIILVVTDDQTAAAFSRAVMPKTSRLIARRGTLFDDAIVTTPLCCPSRATMLSGQYGHNTGILANDPGWPALADRGNLLPVWLRRAGYRTAHVGKWLHHYGEVESKNAVAPGWAQWYTVLAPDLFPHYYDYRLRVNGHAVRYGDEPKDLLTRVLNRTATHLLKRYLPAKRPLYLQLDQLAPHGGKGGTGRCRGNAVPDVRDRKLFRKAALAEPPNFNEADVSDKPSFANERPSLDAQDVSAIRKRYRCALASLRAVDRGVGKIARAVRKAGERRNTAIIFTSDNGFFNGEHRMAHGKGLPYEESVRVPLGIVLPPKLAGRGGQDRVATEPVANVDLAPTILELAGARPCRGDDCRTLDGRSLVDLALGSTAGWPDDRAIAVEFDKPGAAAPSYGDTCAYAGLRTRERLFVDHTELPNPDLGYACEPSPGSQELYHLDDDPFELENLAFTDPVGSAAERQNLFQRLDVLRTCAGIAGRDPEPPGGANCE
jgi:N-acetylglucosamine-6-sulfatase